MNRSLLHYSLYLELNDLTDISVKSIDIETSEVEKKPEYLHKGISARSFNKTFTVSDDVIVKGADLKDGLLYIQLERIIPEEKKARSIKIK